MDKWGLWLLSILLTGTLNAQVQKIAGNYRLEKIQSLEGGLFLLGFFAEVQTGKLDRLELVSDHIHFGVSKGDVLRVAGEVSQVRDDGTGELSQLMILLPTREGQTPVWILSKKFRSRGLNGSRYLKMHAPNADFLVF